MNGPESRWTDPTDDARDDAWASEAGAYVLGALAGAETTAFEAHLATCRACRETVAALAVLPPLLDAVPGDLVRSLATGLGGTSAQDRDVPPVSGEPEEPPPVLLDVLLSRSRQEQQARVRRRRLVPALAAAAVLVVAVALGSTLLPRPWLAEDPAPVAAAAPELEMSAVVAGPVTASVLLEPVRWGTRITLSCAYATVEDGPYGGASRDFSLVVTRADGWTEEVATWAAVPGADLTVPASTVIEREDIVLVEVRSGDGDALLRVET
ncbi:MAG: anti-sigma factor [Actinotalea sp.]|nr:anti-sigma factor [Actinotalea sp.]